MTRVIDQELHEKLDEIVYDFSYSVELTTRRARKQLTMLQFNTEQQIKHVASNLNPNAPVIPWDELRRAFGQTRDALARLGAAAKGCSAVFEDCSWEETDKPVKVAP